MNRSTFKSLFPVVLAIILIANCAKISSPSGGPKDKEPPVVVKSIPVNGARNFNEKRFSITFDEYVVLDKINEKFMVSPPMIKLPKVTMRGKSINVEYEDELKDSTTYTFYFQDAIKDLNEGNIIDNYQFVFSTGPIIDSLSVTGNVYSAYSLDPPENTLILLYRNLADSSVRRQIPDYISRANKNGYFRIDNIRDGKYRLYALIDLDNSKNYNLADEGFAFRDDTLNISAETNYLPVIKDTVKVKPGEKKIADTTVMIGEYKLILYPAQKKSHYLTSSDRKLQYQLSFTLSLPPDSLDFEFSIPGNQENSYFIEKSAAKDTVKVWLTDSVLYKQTDISALVRYPFTDTTGKQILKNDTIHMRFTIPHSTRARTRPAPFSVNTNISTGSLKPGQIITLKSATPFRQPDTSLIKLYELIKTERLKIPYKVLKDTLNSCRLIISAGLKPGKNYLYIADSASMGNIYGENSDSTGIKFTVREAESFGKLKVNIKNYEGDRIIQLLNGNDKVLREKYMKQDGMVEFDLLEKGTYRLRTVYDLNGDGKWTTGDFAAGKQPEPVSFYNKELQMKENWIVEENWDIGEKNIKNLRNKASKTRTNL
jgi:hypothetical protein